jgi:GNAT superfamily N-acetyltransferase
MSRLAAYLQDLRTLPGDAMLAYGRDGLQGAWKTVASRSLHRAFRSGRLIIFAHDLDRLVDVSPPAGVRITELAEKDWPAVASLVGRRELDRFRSLAARGHHCLVAWRGDAALGYAWVAHEIGPDVAPWPLPISFPSSAAYLWNLYVLPSERSGGIGSALASRRLQLAREAGFREGWRMVAPSNASSLRTVQKTSAGTRALGEIRFVQLVGRTYARFTPNRG